MTLGELITHLERYPRDQRIPHGLGNPHSYRGYYERLALEPIGETTVGEMLDTLHATLDRTFEGYKGGEFKMDEWAEVHVAYEGNGEDYNFTLLLAYMLGADPAALRVEPELRRPILYHP